MTEQAVAQRLAQVEAKLDELLPDEKPVGAGCCWVCGTLYIWSLDNPLKRCRNCNAPWEEPEPPQGRAQAKLAAEERIAGHEAKAREQRETNKRIIDENTEREQERLRALRRERG